MQGTLQKALLIATLIECFVFVKPALIDFDTSNKMLVCRCSADSELCTKSSMKGQGSAFEKVLLINFIDTRNSLSKNCIFVDCLLIVS